MKGWKQSLKEDAFFNFIQLSWFKLIGLILSVGFATNIVFAILYVQDFCEFNIDRSLTFFEALSFSAQTYSTVGYGMIAPVGVTANAISMLEMVVGVLSTAVVTGLVFTKFALPKANIRFSKDMLLTQYKGKRSLIFRMVSGRKSEVINLKLKVVAIIPTTTAEGIRLGEVHDLKLQKPLIPVFILSFISAHVLDESSPLFNLSVKELSEKEVRLFVVVEGLDNRTGHPVVEAKEFTAQHLKEGGMFEDVVVFEANKGTRLNMNNLHTLKPKKTDA